MALSRLDCTACGSMSTPSARPAPSLSAAMARMPETATVVQHRFASLQLAVQPLQAQPGSRMAAGANARPDQLQIDGVRVGRRVPGGVIHSRSEMRIGSNWAWGAHQSCSAISSICRLGVGTKPAGGGGDQQRHVLRRVEQRQDAAGCHSAGPPARRVRQKSALRRRCRRRRLQSPPTARSISASGVFRHGGIGVRVTCSQLTDRISSVWMGVFQIVDGVAALDKGRNPPAVLVQRDVGLDAADGHFRQATRRRAWPVRGCRRRRSAWRSSNHSTGLWCSHGKCANPRECQGRRAGGSRRWPGLGTKVNGSSALIRHSMRGPSCDLLFA